MWGVCMSFIKIEEIYLGLAHQKKIEKCVKWNSDNVSVLYVCVHT